MFGVIPQVFFVPLPFFIFGYLWSLFLAIFVGRFWRSFFVGFGVGITHEDVVPLSLVILPPSNPWKHLRFGGFSVEFYERWFCRLTFDSS
jgi:hypothetical protein